MKTLILVILPVLFSLQVYPQKSAGHHPVQTTATTKTRLNLNTISSIFYNDGVCDYNDVTMNTGLTYPRGSGKGAVYISGLLWGAKKPGDPQPRVGGSAYRSGLQPGKIISPGIAEDPTLPKNRIYRIRRDIYPSGPAVNLSIESFDEGLPASEIRQKYETDWLQWPAQDGAPFQDINNNGTYEPAMDIPGVKGAAQTIWYVANDLNPALTTFLYGAQPLGIELQVTLWNYTDNEQLANMYFRKYTLINKSGGAIDSMYVSQWCDPDIGTASDDYVGCDSLKNFCFAYNGMPKDVTYDYIAPALGIDLLQGPVVAGISGQDRNKNGIDDGVEYAVFKGRKKGPGYINLPMTAFYYFARGDANVTDPTQGSIAGSTQFYNFFQGKIGLTGLYITDPITSLPTHYALPGDPIARTGWFDGLQLPPGDRRMGLSAGPFNFGASDTQEVTIVVIAAGGKATSNALKVLRFYNAFAQALYDNMFALPAMPVPADPQVEKSYSAVDIRLNWESGAQLVESFNEQGFAFEGYNVYQLYSEIPAIQNAVKIATYDISNTVSQIPGEIMNTATGYPMQGNIQNGTNSGLQRQLLINHDYIDNYPLIKGRTYKYAVTAYTYNPMGNPKSTETLIKEFQVTFLDSAGGIRYNSQISVTHTAGRGSPLVSVQVYDPSVLTGHNYRVTFSDTTRYTIKWNLIDASTNQTLLSKKAPADTFYLIHGFKIKVEEGAPGVSGYQITAGERQWSWTNGTGIYGLEGFNATIGNAYNNWYSGSSLPLDSLKNVLIKFASTDSLGNLTNVSDPNVSYAYRYLRRANQPVAKPEFVPFIINPTVGYAYQDFLKKFPFAAYDVETTPHRRLAVGFLENNILDGLVDGKYFPPYMNGTLNNTSATGPREWFFIFNSTYAATPEQTLSVDILNTEVPMLLFGTPTRRYATGFSAGSEMLLTVSRPASLNDIFSFNSLVTHITDSDNPLSYELFQNYPNPFNPSTKIRFSLPELNNVKLEVFNILGQRVLQLVNEELDKGTHERVFSTKTLSSGVYIYRMTAGKTIMSKKMVLIR